MRILIADKQSRVRSALALLLQKQTEFVQVGAISRKEQVIPVAQALRPDVILLDWTLVTENTIAALQQIVPRPIIVVLSSQPEAQEYALTAGAEAFISKSAPPNEVIHTLLCVSMRR